MKPFEKKIYLSSPTMHGEELTYMAEAYETNWMSTVGNNIQEAERLTCEQIGCRYAVALSCGTSALHLAVKLAGIKRDEHVFCTDMTFDATLNPVVYEGGIPVFIDTEYDTWNMDPRALEKAFDQNLNIGKFPFAVLNLNISPSEVDVNVHPAKLEVKFANESKVFEIIYHGVTNALLEYHKSTSPFAVIEKEVEQELKTDIQKGLSDEEVKKRQESYGFNELKTKKTNNILRSRDYGC